MSHIKMLYKLKALATAYNSKNFFVLSLKILSMANDATSLLHISGDETYALKSHKIF
jgi:hypothetical protein